VVIGRDRGFNRIGPSRAAIRTSGQAAFLVGRLPRTTRPTIVLEFLGPPIMRHAFAPIDPPIFLCGPSFLIAPRLIVGLGPSGGEHLPCLLEVGARLVEGRGGAGQELARVRSRIEAAVPAPRVLVVRDAGSDRDGADMDVAVIDQPALFASVVVAAAGEGGIASLKPDRAARTIHYQLRCFPLASPIVFGEALTPITS
jgi:hypothetical protein